MKILIVDDHALFRESLSLALSGLEVGEQTILQAEESTQALALARANPDLELILMDIDMPGTNGLDTIRSLHEVLPDVPVIIISAHEEHRSITRAMTLGAKGFIPKTTPIDIMLSALKLVLSGGVYLPPQLLASHNVSDSAAVELTPRQMESLKYLQRGVQNKVIAHELNLSESTVKVHVRRIFTSLGAKNRSQAVNNAIEQGIL